MRVRTRFSVWVALLAALGGCERTRSEAPDSSAYDAGAPDSDAGDASAPGADAADAADVVEDAPPPPRDPLAWSVMQPGPYRVGYRTWMHTYVPPGTTTPRTIPIHAWYPTLATTGRWPLYHHLYVDRFAYTGAPAAAAVHPRGYPVHVYSHGDQGFGPTSFFLMRHFASHGWVAIAPDHTGNTLGNTPDPRPINLYYLRSMDITATLDALAALPASDPLGGGRSDTQRVVMSGHSFGTHTVWASAGATFDVDVIRAACMPAGTCTEADLAAFTAGVREPRVVAAIPMAGAIRREWFGQSGHTGVHIPIFAMSGSTDPVGADVQYDTVTGVDLTWIDVAGGCHQFFGLGGCTTIDDALQPTIVGTYALALARRYVLDDTDATVRGVLENTVPVSNLVTFHSSRR